MSATTAAFLASGRRVRATVAPPTTVNRARNWWRNLLQLRTMGPATVASAAGHVWTAPAVHVWTAPAVQEESDYQRSVRVRSCIRPLVAWRITSVAMQPLWPLALM